MGGGKVKSGGMTGRAGRASWETSFLSQKRIIKNDAIIPKKERKHRTRS